MFAVQAKSKSKGVAEGKQHGAAASPREQASEVNPVWQSLALAAVCCSNEADCQPVPAGK